MPNYAEFYERRHFRPCYNVKGSEFFLSEKNPKVPFGTNILIQDESNPLISIGIEICEDLWVPLSPSTQAALAGATVIANLSASNEIIGKANYRRTLVSA